MKNILFVLIAFYFLALLYGCSNSIEYKVLENNQESNAEINGVNIYLETSLSMKGFVRQINPNQNYKMRTIVPYLLTDCRNTLNGKQILYTFITDSPEIYPHSNSKFRDELRAGNILNGQQSRIHNIIKHVIDSIKPNELSILISDYVLDLGGGLTLQNRDEVTTKLYDQIASKQNLSVAVFQYLSDFNGDFYYCYDNDHPYKNTELHNRPFYIWTFGSPSIIQEAISEGIFKEYSNAFYWGLVGNTLAPVVVSHPRKGQWISSDNTIEILNISDSQPVQFTLGVNLSNLPEVAQTKQFLESNIVIDNANAHGSVAVKLREDYKDSNRPEIVKLSEDERFTHFFEITLKNATSNTGDIEIYLPFKQSDWISSAHLDLDKNPNKSIIPASDIENKTFSLKYITDAFHKKFNKESTLFKITLKQNKL